MRAECGRSTQKGQELCNDLSSDRPVFRLNVLRVSSRARPFCLVLIGYIFADGTYGAMVPMIIGLQKPEYLLG
jgi:hypothetical protein